MAPTLLLRMVKCFEPNFMVVFVGQFTKDSECLLAETAALVSVLYFDAWDVKCRYVSLGYFDPSYLNSIFQDEMLERVVFRFREYGQDVFP